MGDEIKVPGFKTLAQQELAKLKETKGAIRYDVAGDPFGEADLQNIYVRKAAYRKLGTAEFADKVTVLVLVRES